ncbi:hypothetical protein NDU88_002059 [Pleurodeles waltl]|uniref:Uncharacterized protein n=1 Tax=Pleurodeles waltl TaxID=8319 RepID=A0AAV7RA98_PLEWA|nr:hypothetical protein NDU88_002059 [Pleurodeles waltl]
MAASSVADSWAGGALEERTLGAASKMAAPININEEEVVVISDDEEDVQAIYRPSGGMVGDQSLPVKVQAPSEHRREGRVRSGAVRPTSGDTTGADDAQPSTSQGAGAGWAYLDEELLDYEE